MTWYYPHNLPDLFRASLDADQTRHLLNSIAGDRLADLRDRAIIGTMVYTFARVGAVVAMDVGDYYAEGGDWVLRLQEKGGKEHFVPAHFELRDYLRSYLEYTELASAEKSPLFQSISSDRRRLRGARATRHVIYKMIKRRARAAGLPPSTCCHTFRATGITNYLDNDGTLEEARLMAAHEDARTTRLYDRRERRVIMREVQRIRF